MAIPSGDVAHALAFERLVPVDEILEDLVQGVADVEVAVGVGRAVVQGEELGVLALGDLLVHALVRPELLDGGLLGDRVGAHLEGGLGEEDGVPVDVLLLLTLATLALALLGGGGAIRGDDERARGARERGRGGHADGATSAEGANARGDGADETRAAAAGARRARREQSRGDAARREARVQARDRHSEHETRERTEGDATRGAM